LVTQIQLDTNFEKSNKKRPLLLRALSSYFL